MTIGWARHFVTGLSSLRDRAAARLAALRFNPSRRQRIAILGGFFFMIAVLAGAKGDILFSLCYFALTFACLVMLDKI